MIRKLDSGWVPSFAELRRRLAGGGWIRLLMFVPVLTAVVILASLFLAFFLTLFLIVGAGIALRLWWFRRKLRRTADPHTIDGDYVVIDKRITVIETPQSDSDDRGEP
jgi:membrane protein implicated in regulation of membrane protease activity